MGEDLQILPHFCGAFDVQQEGAVHLHLSECLQVLVQGLHGTQGESGFSIRQISHDDALVRFYTGLPSYQHFEKLFIFLSDCSASMPLWRGSSCHEHARSRQTGPDAVLG